MSPRSASVNEAMRRRSRDRLLQATVELVEERGYEATTLADITQRAGSARGLVSYYYSGKRALVQSAVHRLMHRELAAALEAEPAAEVGEEVLARAIDAILGLTVTHTKLMRTHMSLILADEGFIRCPEQQRLAALLEEPAARLPMIDRRRIEICRALISRPRLLLLDEPSAGMTHEETRDLMDDILSVRARMSGLTIVIIEHEMGVIERVTDRCVVLNYGRKIKQGTFAEVAGDRQVQEAYLGVA